MNEMKQEYDFGAAERGKFFRQGAVVRLPVYLDQGLQDYLSAVAERKGKSLSELVNDLLSRELSIQEALR
jgi:hypothetical protein